MNYKFSRVVFIIVLLVAINGLYSQTGIKPIFIETNISPLEKSSRVDVSYKIPYKHLVFVKGNDVYKSGLTFTVEAYSGKDFAAREFSSEKVQTENYNETESSEKFLEGFVSFLLPEGEYKFNPTLNLDNTNRSVKLSTYEVEIDDSKIVKPIPVNGNLQNNNSSKVFRTVNYGNAIPFTKQNISLLIPVNDKTVKSVNVLVEQDDKEVYNKELKIMSSGFYEMAKLGRSIALNLKTGENNFNYFLLEDISSKLKEGKVDITVSGEGDEEEFEFNVEWLDKPKSLFKPELAIMLLENITDRQTVDELLSADDEEYYNKLLEFWNPKDPNKETVINEIMYEFYSRADYAISNFSTVDLNNGAKSDRGKVYIKYGDPDDIIRTYSDKNEVIEIWKYNQSHKEFTFIDKSGLGNFSLY